MENDPLADGAAMMMSSLPPTSLVLEVFETLLNRTTWNRSGLSQHCADQLAA
jgi:hypothetical protein